MPFYSIYDAANLRGVLTRQIYRLISRGKLRAEKDSSGSLQVWLDDDRPAEQPQMIGSHLDLPGVPASAITDDLLKKVDAMLLSIGVESGHIDSEGAREQLAEQRFGLRVKTQHNYKSSLRKLFRLQPRASLSSIVAHPQIRQAIIHILAPKQRSDRGSLRVCKGLSVAAKSTGELISIEEFLRAHYGNPGVSATAVWEALRGKFLANLVVHDVDSSRADISELPPERTVRAWCQREREQKLALQRARSRKKDWQDNREPYVTRDLSQYRPGEIFCGDHTELDFMVMNEEGKLDRRWITAFIDVRSRLLVGHCLSWQPNSDTIGISFRNSVTGSQLMVFHNGEYVPKPITSICDEVWIDNGKDYKSRDSKRSFGQIKFSDDAERMVQSLTRLHYVQPYHGQSKPIERFWKTIQEMMRSAPGYKGNVYQNKPDSLADDIKQGNIMNVAEFDAFVVLMINTYNNRPHRSLAGLSPMQCYLLNQTVQKTIDIHVLDFLLMKATPKAIRRGQFKLFGAEYYHIDLMNVQGRADSVRIYYDPRDLGYVSVYVNGVFKCVAINKAMIGVDAREMKKVLVDRAHTEKQLQAEIKRMRGSLTQNEIRANILAGKLQNIVEVSGEMMKLRPTNLIVKTGLEDQAALIEKETAEAKEGVEFEERSKKRRAGVRISIVKLL